MSESPSPFYPPRARWYSRGAYAWMRVGRHLSWSRARMPGDVSFWNFLGSVALPGHALFVVGRPLWGWITLAAWSVGALFFLVRLGYTESFVAFGLMIAAHVNCVLFLLKRMADTDESVFRRIVYLLGYAAAVAAVGWFALQGLIDTGDIVACLALLTLLAFITGWFVFKFGATAGFLSARVLLAAATLLFYIFCVYRPALWVVHTRWLVPLRVDERVIVVNRLARMSTVARGQTVAYELRRDYLGQGVYMRGGFGFDRVLALPGETVRFTATTYEVNGQEFPRLPHMPLKGEARVPQKHWFIWPRVAIDGHGVPEADLSSFMKNIAMVTEDQLIGRPFQHWFGRRQTLP